jgi:hypothetical protein
MSDIDPVGDAVCMRACFIEMSSQIPDWSDLRAPLCFIEYDTCSIFFARSPA